MIKDCENLLMWTYILRWILKNKLSPENVNTRLTWSSLGYRYVITTYTGDRFGAGTDARVFIRLFGSKGNTKEKELESSGRDNFERGQ